MNIDQLIKDAQHASWLGMDSKAAGLFRRLAIIHQHRATQRRIQAIDATAAGIEFEPIDPDAELLPLPGAEDLTYEIPAFLRRQAE